MKAVVLQGDSPSDPLSLLSEENRQLKAQLHSLQQQLDWFKKQLFGQKSEKRLIEPNPEQASLFEVPASSEATEMVPGTQYLIVA